MKHLLSLLFLLFSTSSFAKITTPKGNPQAQYAATRLSSLDGKGYNFKFVLVDKKFHFKGDLEGLFKGNLEDLEENSEAFVLARKGKTISIISSGAGWIYGANRLLEYYRDNGSLNIPKTIFDKPEMVLRGACLGVQKTEYLPGRKVYEYPYTKESFPWFYDKALWIEYLDMLAAANMNSVYLWNGHPFASLVKLDDYPFAVEVSEEQLQQNREIFSFITTEAQRRGIRIYQMFYNILLSKPFAEHYGLSTQDRNRPITPLISDYTRKSIAKFVEEYPNVGFLLCLGEAMATIDDDVRWMKETIIPGVLDGLKARGSEERPPLILRSHDTDGPLVLKESLPLYPNIYTMSKYTGESLTTYEPRGPWAETHRQLAAAAPVHVSNVHILANLEPWRWASPAFVSKTVKAMHNVHHANGLHLFPQANYWDWPYTADKVAAPISALSAPVSKASAFDPYLDGRLKQTFRDRIWFDEWGRYAWKADRGDDSQHWIHYIQDFYGCDEATAAKIIEAYDESGEIAPKLLRRFGITEGNRQSLLLGMKMSQLVNPYKYTIYPGFYESCGPEGEKLIEFVEKEFKGEKHVGELPWDIVCQCVEHGEKAVLAIEGLTVTKNIDEFRRLQNDMRCYKAFAESFKAKVGAATIVLSYKWKKNPEELAYALMPLHESLEKYKELVALTKDTYLYGPSMQTSQRRIPVGGDGGKYKTWEEMLPVYEEEYQALYNNVQKLLSSAKPSESLSSHSSSKPSEPLSSFLSAPVSKASAFDMLPRDANGKPYALVSLAKGAKLFEERDEAIDTLAAELVGLDALVMNRDTTRINGGVVEFDSEKPVQMLVGFFIDDQNKFASPPKLEIDATGNLFGQAEPVLTHAIAMSGMPMVNIHSYHLPAGHHKIHLPKGIIMVAGFTSDKEIKPRDCGLAGAGVEVDWLFME